eukprot:TRINITY_DN55813_c0_g1_i1.p1 TRINITY_DN55813_c0_g1~~TRINITY_DN55813_c0_g1_i1.p1  ORF type:complete len:1121 (-),score=190.69 TRINITY_DN55813_c0_g1_i1:349-3711(-)
MATENMGRGVHNWRNSNPSSSPQVQSRQIMAPSMSGGFDDGVPWAGCGCGSTGPGVAGACSAGGGGCGCGAGMQEGGVGKGSRGDVAHKLFVSGLSPATTSERLMEHFGNWPTFVQVFTDRETGRSKCCAKVDCGIEKRAQQAISNFDGSFLDGCQIRVGQFVIRTEEKGPQIFVGSIPDQATEESLVDHIQNAIGARFCRARLFPTSLGRAAVVELSSPEEVTTAIMTLHESNYLGSQLVVKEAKAADGCGVFVAGLPYDTDEDGLRALFADIGEVSSCSVFRDRETGASRGCGKVRFATVELAERAIRVLSNRQLGGRTLRVELLGDGGSKVGGGGNPGNTALAKGGGPQTPGQGYRDVRSVPSTPNLGTREIRSTGVAGTPGSFQRETRNSGSFPTPSTSHRDIRGGGAPSTPGMGHREMRGCGAPQSPSVNHRDIRGPAGPPASGVAHRDIRASPCLGTREIRGVPAAPYVNQRDLAGNVSRGLSTPVQQHRDVFPEPAPRAGPATPGSRHREIMPSNSGVGGCNGANAGQVAYMHGKGGAGDIGGPMGKGGCYGHSCSGPPGCTGAYSVADAHVGCGDQWYPGVDGDIDQGASAAPPNWPGPSGRDVGAQLWNAVAPHEPPELHHNSLGHYGGPGGGCVGTCVGGVGGCGDCGGRCGGGGGGFGCGGGACGPNCGGDGGCGAGCGGCGNSAGGHNAYGNDSYMADRMRRGSGAPYPPMTMPGAWDVEGPPAHHASCMEPPGGGIVDSGMGAGCCCCGPPPGCGPTSGSYGHAGGWEADSGIAHGGVNDRRQWAGSSPNLAGPNWNAAGKAGASPWTGPNGAGQGPNTAALPVRRNLGGGQAGWKGGSEHPNWSSSNSRNNAGEIPPWNDNNGGAYEGQGEWSTWAAVGKGGGTSEQFCGGRPNWRKEPARPDADSDAFAPGAGDKGATASAPALPTPAQKGVAKLLVTGLAPVTTSAGLREHFSGKSRNSGSVTSAYIFTDLTTGASRCVGQVDFNSEEIARYAIERFDGSTLDGNKISVQPFSCVQELQQLRSEVNVGSTGAVVSLEGSGDVVGRRGEPTAPPTLGWAGNDGQPVPEESKPISAEEAEKAALEAQNFFIGDDETEASDTEHARH